MMHFNEPLTAGLRRHIHKKRSCNCKNSRCTKLYCECFAAGVYCNDTCNCANCFNNKVRAPSPSACARRLRSSGYACAAHLGLRCLAAVSGCCGPRCA